MKEELIKLHFDKAHKFLVTAHAIIELGDYSASISRSYYSMYHIVESLFFAHGLSSKTHAGKNTLFNKEFIKTGIFENELGAIYHQMLNDRMLGDYGSEESFNENDAIDNYEKAKKFIDKISDYLIQNYKL